ncbi:cupin domain-containing protein [Granulosicoccaceae sp. 1_MG-2023]|nr:cupin domain-containing protein [Granulosicoccaceae sp. 1_MG-2023]
MRINWPDGIDEAVFLRDYWQKKPLLIRNAFPDWDNPLSPEELAGLSLEDDIPSRLIREISPTEWTLQHGPLDEATLTGLPAYGYSLLVSDIEKLLPDFITYVQPFRFIPDWRIDDLMISYAPEGGSVGPHTDQYDVFLLQASGTREWRLGDGPVSDPELLPLPDLKILRDFKPAHTHTLSPGDLLYLPPRLAHHGISRDDRCMTWSVGFRAPSAAAMVADFGRFLGSKINADTLYPDPDLAAQKNPGEITPHAIGKLTQMLKDHLITDETLFAEWVGRFLTEAGSSGWLGPDADDSDSAALLATLEETPALERCTQSRLAFVAGEEQCSFFVNGECFSAGQALAEALCRDYRYNSADLQALANTRADRQLLAELIKRQVLLPVE